MGYAISIHENDTTSRLEIGFSLIYSHVPRASVALQKKLYFHFFMKDNIIYLFHKSPYQLYDANRGHIFLFLIPGWIGWQRHSQLEIENHSQCQMDLAY